MPRRRLSRDTSPTFPKGTQVFPALADQEGMHDFQIIETHDGSATVIEIDERLTPPGLALELHCVTYEDETVAFWLFEDGSVAKIEEVALA